MRELQFRPIVDCLLCLYQCARIDSDAIPFLCDCFPRDAERDRRLSPPGRAAWERPSVHNVRPNVKTAKRSLHTRSYFRA